MIKERAVGFMETTDLSAQGMSRENTRSVASPGVGSHSVWVFVSMALQSCQGTEEGCMSY